MRLLMIIFLTILFSGSAQAQCRIGSGPDQGDGIPWCSLPPAPAPHSEPLPPNAPPQWQDFAAAIAWADSDQGSEFVGVSKHFDELSARETALLKCQLKGWGNCAVATSIVNGVILIARDSDRALRTRTAATEREAREGLTDKCREAGVTCKVLAVFDGTAEYF